MNVRARSFRDQQGNQFVFPAHIYSRPEDEPIDWFFRALAIRTATGLELDDDWLEFDPENFPHIKTRIGSPGFAHGSEAVLLVGGPEFSKVAES